MKKILITTGLLMFGWVAIASAHVVVSPSSAGIGSELTFTISVPSEKPLATIGLKLLIPSGLGDVTPNVKPGWRINVKKTGDTVTEIDWTGGSIPANERDQFLFSAQVPATPTELDWKAYQTYSDGSVVSWDLDPQTNPDAMTPYSHTTVVNDLTATTSPHSPEATTALILSIIALVFALWALRKSNQNS